LAERRRLRILIVEDEMLVAMNIEDMLIELGHEVAGIASRLDAALGAAGGGGFDAAVLDVNLAGERSFPVANLLAARGIPFLFATGYGAQGIEEDYRGWPVLQKPFRAADLAAALDALASGPEAPQPRA
jgi:CheY-like chemotaxis protein